MGIVYRFQGASGANNRIEAILEQAIVAGNRELAKELSDLVEIVAVSSDEAIITQDNDDNDLYLILSGSFRIEVNGKQVATRGRQEHVGEMAFVEPTQRRAASVVAQEPSIVAKLTANDLVEIGSRYPEIYRQIAKGLARRLRERNKFAGQHRQRSRVFIISSAEALPIARIIQSSFEHEPFLTTLWTDGVFRATSYALEALENAVENSDFAIAIAHSDDLTQFRGQDWPSPRDNVVFELGLFMGKLGRRRAILMEPREDKVRLPSDLSGVTTIPYRYEAGRDAAALMAPACHRLSEHIKEWGPFNG